MLQKILRAVAWLFSIVFHPIGFAFVGLTVLLFSTRYEFVIVHQYYTAEYLFRVFVLTYIIPLIWSGWQYSIFHLFSRNKNYTQARLLNLLMVNVIYFFSYKYLLAFKGFSIANSYLLVCIVLMTISAIITYFWKISLHMIGIGGFSGLLFSIAWLYSSQIAAISFPIIILTSGIVGSSRLILKAHTPAQIYSGYSIGFIVSIFFLYFLLL